MKIEQNISKVFSSFAAKIADLSEI